MKKIFQFALFLLTLVPTFSYAQDNLEVVSSSEIPVTGVIASATLKSDENKELSDYAIKKFNMKTPTGLTVGNSKRTVMEVKNPQTGKIHKFTTVMYDLKPTKAGDKSEAVIINISDETGKTYKAILYAKDGNKDNVEEANVTKSTTGKLQVGGFKSFWKCVKGNLTSATAVCGATCLQSFSQCKGGWVAYLACVSVKCGGCYAKASASCIGKLFSFW
jgi:hypothetical protein